MGLQNPIEGEQVQRAIKTVTFDGTAGGGAVGTVALFTVTGRVRIVSISAYVSTTLTESVGDGTISLGDTGNVTRFIAATTSAGLAAGEVWVDATPNQVAEAMPAALRDVIESANVQFDVVLRNITGGVIEVYCQWMPLSSGATLVPA